MNLAKIRTGPSKNKGKNTAKNSSATNTLTHCNNPFVISYRYQVCMYVCTLLTYYTFVLTKFNYLFLYLNNINFLYCATLKVLCNKQAVTELESYRATGCRYVLCRYLSMYLYLDTILLLT